MKSLKPVSRCALIRLKLKPVNVLSFKSVLKIIFSMRFFFLTILAVAILETDFFL